MEASCLQARQLACEQGRVKEDSNLVKKGSVPPAAADYYLYLVTIELAEENEELFLQRIKADIKPLCEDNRPRAKEIMKELGETPWKEKDPNKMLNDTSTTTGGSTASSPSSSGSGDVSNAPKAKAKRQPKKTPPASAIGEGEVILDPKKVKADATHKT